MMGELPETYPGRILVLAPMEVDAHAVQQVLTRGGFSVEPFVSLLGFVEAIGPSCGAVIVAEEALTEEGAIDQLGAALAKQPDWSDLPVILLARPSDSEDSAWAMARALEGVGNITILERPLRRSTLVNAVKVALRSRVRQYELRNHKELLETKVAQRTEELERSMRQLHSQERLAALGTLAAGLGHDIANLVLPVRMRLDQLTRECPSGAAREDIEAIGTALRYLTNTSAGLRLMSLDPAGVGSDFVADVAVWWEQVQGVLRGVLPRHVRLEGDLPAGLGIRVAAHRLTQAVFNLVQNSGEALADRPHGMVRVAAVRTEGPSGANVRLTVADDGPGMMPEVIKHCFEPYYSTKGRAISTGMGLSMVRGVAESAGGSVSVESEPGGGATFVLNLPANDAAEAKASPAKEGAGRVRVAAMSVRDAKLGAIATMLLKDLDLNVISWAAGSPPESELWVVEEPTRDLMELYVRRDPKRRLVVLEHGGVLRRAVSDDARLRGQVTVVPLPAPASVLRRAISSAAAS